MNSKYLGDALDHWKGSIIHRLASRKLLQNIAAVPMLTDGPWNSQKISAYSQLLNLNSNKLVLQNNEIFRGYKHNRKEYFGNIIHSGDLFLDPDKGVSISTSTNDKEHINVSEIKKLLDNDRVILTYQHRGRKKRSEQVTNILYQQVKEIISHVLGEIEDLHSTTYECGVVAMLFFSYSEGRIVEIKDYLKNKMLFGDPEISKRVNIWPHQI